MPAFKRKEQVLWASDKAIKLFVDEVALAWEAKKLSAVAVSKKAALILDDAASGELKLEGKNIYVVKLLVKMRNAGVEIPDDRKATPKKTSYSKYC